jgi:hypothetical protein
MTRINEFNIEPGVYQHYKGSHYVVVELVTHMENAAVGKMEPLPDPLVVYRDLQVVMRHVNGKYQNAHQVYARAYSEFNGMVDLPHDIKVKRFTKV